MNYTLNTKKEASKKVSVIDALKSMWPLIHTDKKKLAISFVAIIVNSALTLLGPLLLGYAVNHYVVPKDYHGVLVFSGILLISYGAASLASYIQIRVMGTVSQRMLFTLRKTVFEKLETLPVAFFNQNKSGDLISRINNDTDKLNQFFSQSLMQFVGNVFVIIGAGIFILSIKPKLGLMVLIPAVFLLLFMQLTGGWIKKRNLKNLQAGGLLSAEIQESLDNFKVIVAFDRRDYFREKFALANNANFAAAQRSGRANNVLAPVFDISSNAAQLIVLVYGIYLISVGQFSIGFLVSYVGYANRFYEPLRQMASLWASFQVALAGFERISEILEMQSDLVILPRGGENLKDASKSERLEFKNVSFSYPDGHSVLSHVSLSLEPGKTYALVGPTGGGKTTTASLMARLFDPTEGVVLLDGADIRSFSHLERTDKIGFILQEPFLFSGSLKQNLSYGNTDLEHLTDDEFTLHMKKTGLDSLVSRFENGLETKIASASDQMSLGERQIIAFMRAVLRKPEILILDEATANIDTVTEEILGDILSKLPATATRVIIAHRLNTIRAADEIFFVNSGSVTPAGSFDHAVDMLLHGKRRS